MPGPERGGLLLPHPAAPLRTTAPGLPANGKGFLARLRSSDLAALGWLIVLVVLVRGLTVIPASTDPDEGLYALQAREWLHGGWPYVAVWDMHPVGAPALFAVAIGLLGETVLAMRLLGMAAVTATGFLLLRLTTAAGGSRAIGLIAASAYVAHTILPGGAATNTELLLAPFVVGGWALAVQPMPALLAGRRPPLRARVLMSGLAFGMALWIKQVAAPEAMMAFAMLAGLALALRAVRLAEALVLAALFALGCALPTAVTALAYAWNGTLDAFVTANVVAPLHYVSANAPDTLLALRLTAAAVFRAGWLIAALVLALVMVVRQLDRPLARSLARPLARSLARVPARPANLLPVVALGWFLAATAGVVMPGKYFHHYFLMWLPPLCLGAACGVMAAVELIGARRPRRAALLLTALLITPPVLANLAGVAGSGFGLRQADPQRQLASAIARLVPSGETAFLVNYEPVVYFLAGLPLPTRLPFWQQLTGHYGDAIGTDGDAELARVLANRPALLVVARNAWEGMRPEAQAAVTAALAASYELAGTMPEAAGPVELWRRR